MTSETPPPTAQELAQGILAFDIDDQLVRRHDLGASLSFEGGREDFERAQNVARSISRLPVQSTINTSHYINLRNILAELNGALLAVEHFSPSNVNQPSTQRDFLIGQVRQHTRSALEQFMPIAGYLLLESGGLGEVQERLAEAITTWESRAADSLDEQQDRLDHAIQRAELSVQTAHEAAAAAQTAAGRTGVTEYSRVFEDEASFHAEQATRWLQGGVGGATVLVAIIALMVAVFPAGERIDDPAVVQWLLLKALVVSFGSYLVFQAFRIFRAEQHLMVSNRHRDKALRTFETFAAASTDNSTRDAVLLEATRSIFAPGATGLVDSGESAPGPAALLEVIRRTQTAPPAGS